MDFLDRSRALVVLLAALCQTAPVAQASGPSCVPPGRWVQLADGGARPVATDRYLAELARKQVVLLGESHDSAEHHRWQLHTISALHALNPDLVLGFEMFPRRAQPVLDDWTAGKLTEAELLARSDWNKVWGFDPQLYLPVFHFARMHRIPMAALNIDRALVRRIGDVGWNAIPPAEREGIDDPAAPSPAYLDELYGAWLAHLPQKHPARASDSPRDTDTAEFRRFVESMQAWDRAMAQGIAARVQPPGRLVVVLMGSGHLRDGHGVPHQLHALGVREIASLLPWDADNACDALQTGLADAVFGVDAPVPPPQAERPRLGILLDQDAAGVAVREVVQDSIAARAGLRAGDILTQVAGRAVSESADVIAAVQRQAPGTWLPMTVRRGDQLVELVARFPPPP